MVKRTAQDNETICFEIYSVISTSKNGETKFYKAFDDLESLVKNDGGSNAREQLIKESEPFDKQNGRGRGKNGRRPRFLSW